MNTGDEKPVGRCLRSGLKPNFRPDFKPNKRRNKTKQNEKNVPKLRLRINKFLINDKKLFASQTVRLERLRGHVIKKYDKDFYNRYSKQLKAEKALIKYSKIRQFLVKSKPKANANPKITANESPKRMLLWTSPNSKLKQQQTSYPVLRSHVRRLAKCDDRENSLMCLPEFCRNLNLISYNDLNRMNAKQMNTSYSIRHISKSEDYSLNHNNEIEINYEYLIGRLDENQNPNSSEFLTKKRKNKRTVWTANKVKQKYSKIESQKFKLAELWKKQYLNCMSMYETSSPMGRRVFYSLKTKKIEPKKIQSNVKRYESYCGTRLRFKVKEGNELNGWKARRIERLTTGQELSQRNGLLNCHQYTFTRRQRLEKVLRAKTGIDWKSRLLALNCRQTEVTIHKMRICPICGQNIMLNHSCDNSASHCKHTSPPRLSDDSKQSQTLISSDNQRVLRHRIRLSDEKGVKSTPIISPKKKFLPEIKRICTIDLSQD